MCNCEFCVKCDCGHRADEHLAGDGQCFKCFCGQFHSPIVDEREKLHLIPEKKFQSFQEFADKWVSEH